MAAGRTSALGKMTRGTKTPPGSMTMLAGYVLLGTVPPLVRAARSLNVSSTELVLIRFVGGSLLVLLIARATASALSTQQPRLLLLRGLLGACAVQLYFLGIQLAG